MTQHRTDNHFVTYNFVYHAMVFNLSWDHPRSNTLYSDLSGSLSWDHPRSNTLYSDLSGCLSWDHPRSNTLYSDLSGCLSWDHPRSNTLYSNSSWDVLLLLYLGSSKVQYPVLQVTTNKLTALPNLLLMVEFMLSNSSVFFARVDLGWLYFDQSKAMCALQCLLIDKNLKLLGIIKLTVLLIRTWSPIQ